MRSVPCSLTGNCTAPISIEGIGTDCSTSRSAYSLNQTLLYLNSSLTALDFSFLTATYYCIPAVRLSISPATGILPEPPMCASI